MADDEFVPGIDIDADYATGTIAAMLDVDPDSLHGPRSFDCDVCAEWWQLVKDAVNFNGEPLDILQRLRPTVPEGHPTEDCIPCDGCRFELQYAVDLIKEVVP